MDSSLPTSLKHIISNVEYYGPVLFMAGICGKIIIFNKLDYLLSLSRMFLASLVAEDGFLTNWAEFIIWVIFFLGIVVCETHAQRFPTWSLFLSLTAIDVVTVYVFHEPSLLSSLQDNGLTSVMLKALVVKEVGYVVSQYIHVHFK